MSTPPLLGIERDGTFVGIALDMDDLCVVFDLLLYESVTSRHAVRV